MKKILAGLMLALWILPAQLMAQNVKTVAVVGDSNTRYIKKLQENLGEGWKVVNCGKGGVTVVGYHRVPHYQKALKSKPDYVTIMLGTNDAFYKRWIGNSKPTRMYKDGNQPKHFTAAYLKLIDDFQALESKPQVIVVVPPPCSAERSNKEKHGDSAAKGQKVLEDEVIPLVRKIAEERKLPVIDIFGVLKDAPNDYKGDAWHFSRKGYDAMADAFAKKLKELDSK